MIRWAGFTLLAASLLLLSCGGGSRKHEDKPLPAKVHARDIQTDYYPLRIGNTWTYQTSTLGEKTEQTISVDRKEGKFYHLDGGGGGLLHRDGYGIRDQARYLLRFPVEQGGKWDSILAHDSIEHYEIIAVGQRVEVPAGTFTGCVVVTSTQTIDQHRALVNEVTFAPGVGIVRLQTAVHEGGKAPAPQVMLELMRYKVGPTDPPKRP